jgi:hypothetical protein
LPQRIAKIAKEKQHKFLSLCSLRSFAARIVLELRFPTGAPLGKQLRTEANEGNEEEFPLRFLRVLLLKTSIHPYPWANESKELNHGLRLSRFAINTRPAIVAPDIGQNYCLAVFRHTNFLGPFSSLFLH